ncbi:hypothetical protein EXIGLDRAFT_452514 [Exidia glandulosa HHB12029]|uniref:Uncharacterized protein n=1 Tax=Exidia glandulosa HHB12029 TaxID=1314781 RepID=A0A166AWW9_EXIGL|nr:hypothetical protein EXIGLDRAFT_452514 [Exidia glandulosa HHB12029]
MPCFIMITLAKRLSHLRLVPRRRPTDVGSLIMISEAQHSVRILYTLSASASRSRNIPVWRSGSGALCAGLHLGLLSSSIPTAYNEPYAALSPPHLTAISSLYFNGDVLIPYRIIRADRVRAIDSAKYPGPAAPGPFLSTSASIAAA